MTLSKYQSVCLFSCQSNCDINHIHQAGNPSSTMYELDLFSIENPQLIKLSGTKNKQAPNDGVIIMIII